MGLSRPSPSGRYAQRALIPRDGQVTPDPPADPRGDIVPNANAPVGTVGADVPAGVGDSHVMYPGYVSATPWAGWPVGWDTPYMETTPTHSTFFGYGEQDPAGYATRVSTVGTCVDINSRAVVAMAAYAVKAGVPGDLPDWYQTSPEPLVYADWCEFIGRVVDDLMMSGEAILWATDSDESHYADGYPRRFVALDPARVEIDQRGGYAVTIDGGEPVQLDRADVCHIKYKHDRATGRGFGPLAWAGRDVVSADVLNRYADNLARNGTSAVLSAPGDLTAQQADDLRRDWARLRGTNPGVPAVLSGGITYASQSMSPKDMALLDLKIFDLQMIANAFGVPSTLAGLPTAAGGLSYSSPQMVARQHWTNMLLPLCQKIAGALSNWALPRGTRFEFNPNRYLQGDAMEQVQALAAAFAVVDEKGRRALTVDEFRTMFRLAPWDAVRVGGAPAADAVVGSDRG
jgi:HK97 family phage portal protein